MSRVAPASSVALKKTTRLLVYLIYDRIIEYALSKRFTTEKSSLVKQRLTRVFWESWLVVSLVGICWHRVRESRQQRRCSAACVCVTLVEETTGNARAGRKISATWTDSCSSNTGSNDSPKEGWTSPDANTLYPLIMEVDLHKLRRKRKWNNL